MKYSRGPVQSDRVIKKQVKVYRDHERAVRTLTESLNRARKDLKMAEKKLIDAMETEKVSFITGDFGTITIITDNKFLVNTLSYEQE